MIFFSNFALRFRNAKVVINQIKSGEWSEKDLFSGVLYAVYRDGRKLWLANGSFFCDLVDPETNEHIGAFGLIWRHWVWFSAARKLKRDTERRARKIRIPEL
ncbi:hypothetical protein [Lonsdalea quercina]